MSVNVSVCTMLGNDVSAKDGNPEKRSLLCPENTVSTSKSQRGG